MASNALTCSATPLVSNKASFGSLPIALGPQSLVPRVPWSSKTPPLRLSLVVRAGPLESEGGLSNEIEHLDALIPLRFHKRVALLDISPYMRTPWNTTEDENEIRMWFDVPGLAATDIDVHIVDSLLIIKGTEGVDGLGRKIYSPLDCKLQLPFDCAKEETQAVLKNGVLYITVPKITKTEHMKHVHVPVRAI